MDIGSLLNQATHVGALFDTARDAFTNLKTNVAGAKSALAEDDLKLLEEKLADIHAKNLALSAELDANLAALERRG